MTLYFEDPYWVAVLEVSDDAGVHAARHVFGAEPSDAELYDFLLRHGSALFARAGRSPAVTDDRPAAAVIGNPKRLARAAAREAAEFRPGTAAQEALKKAAELRKQESAQRERELRGEQDSHRREVRRAKTKARRRGH